MEPMEQWFSSSAGMARWLDFPSCLWPVAPKPGRAVQDSSCVGLLLLPVYSNTVWPMSAMHMSSCTSLLYFVVRVGCRRKTVHVRCLISWWAFCTGKGKEWKGKCLVYHTNQTVMPVYKEFSYDNINPLNTGIQQLDKWQNGLQWAYLLLISNFRYWTWILLQFLGKYNSEKI